MSHTIITRATGRRTHVRDDGSSVRTGTVTDDGWHIAAASFPAGPAMAFEGRTAVEASERAAAWLDRGRQ